DVGCTATRCQFSPRHIVFEESGVRSRRGRPLPSPATSPASDDAPSLTADGRAQQPLQVNDVHPTRRETMQHRNIPHTLKLVPLALALGLAIALPAQADPAGPGCWTFNDTTGEWEQSSDPTNRTEGNEHGDANTTCVADASAYGKGNNASGVRSSAFGVNNIA